MSQWRDRHERFEHAFGPSWRSTILGMAAIVLSLLLMGAGGLAVAFDSTRTLGVAVSGQGLALLVAGIAAVWMREEKASDKTHDQEMTRIQHLEAEVAQMKQPPRESTP